ncbi:rRNA maturation RNase YbeY [Candidatus Neomarinimicrobiota bacterium]
MITVAVETSDNEPPPLAKGLIERLITTTWHGENTEIGAVQVIFMTDEELRELKQRFFNEDIYTDVISFNLNGHDESLDGEIYISTARALENSLEFKQTHEQELCRLVVHGALHLLGYDDKSDQDRAKMTSLENKYLHLTAAIS